MKPRRIRQICPIKPENQEKWLKRGSSTKLPTMLSLGFVLSEALLAIFVIALLSSDTIFVSSVRSPKPLLQMSTQLENEIIPQINTRQLDTEEKETVKFLQASAPLTLGEGKKLLFLNTCGDFLENRLALASAIYLAHENGRVTVIPTKSLNVLFDTENLKTSLAQLGVHIVDENEVVINAATKITCNGNLPFHSCMEELSRTDEQILWECPKFDNSILDDATDENLFMAILSAIKPCEKLKEIIKLAQDRMKLISAVNTYNFLRYTDVTFNNDTLNSYIKTFTDKGFDSGIIVYISAFWGDVFKDPNRPYFVKKVESAVYGVVSRLSLFPMQPLSQDELNTVEYFLGLESIKSFGDSRDPLYCMLLVERRFFNKWSAKLVHETASGIPKEKLPWVFTHNTLSTNIEYMVKASVRSANKVGGFHMIGIILGTEETDIVKWLQSQNVYIIMHVPLWAPKLTARNFYAKELEMKSWLYFNPEALMTTYLRIDMPILDHLKQYDYVFYADTDLYFRKRFNWDDIPSPLPETVGFAWEMKDSFPYNAGVGVWNLVELRRSYDKFLDFILSNEGGLYYNSTEIEYGVVDQGSYNQFYEESIRKWQLPQEFNAKPYNDYIPESRVVHFHAMKPLDYLDFANRLKCRYYGICRDAYNKALCHYIPEYLEYVPEMEELKKINEFCVQIDWYSRDTNRTVGIQRVGYYRKVNATKSATAVKNVEVNF